MLRHPTPQFLSIHIMLKVLRISDGWVPIPLGSGTSGKGTERQCWKTERRLWNAIFRAQHSHYTQHGTISQQLWLSAQGLQKTETVKKQSLIGKDLKGLYHHCRTAGYNGFWEKGNYCPGSMDSPKSMVTQIVSDKISGAEDNTMKTIWKKKL